MKVFTGGILAATTVLVAACAAQKVGTPEAAPTMILSELVVNTNLKAGVPYPASLRYRIEGKGDVIVTKSCFTWSGEGPYCFNVSDDRSAGEAKTRLRTNNPNSYTLLGYLKYTSNGYEKQTPAVGVSIIVK